MWFVLAQTFNHNLTTPACIQVSLPDIWPLDCCCVFSEVKCVMCVSDEARDGALWVGHYQTPRAGERGPARRRRTDRRGRQRCSAVSRETSHRVISAVPLPVCTTLQPELKEHLHVYGRKRRLHHYRLVRYSFLTNKIWIYYYFSLHLKSSTSSYRIGAFQYSHSV